MDTAIILRLHRGKDGGWGFVDEDNQSAIQIKSCKIAKDELNLVLASDPVQNNLIHVKSVSPFRLGASGKVCFERRRYFF